MHKQQLLHICRQLLANEPHLQRIVRRWVRRIKARDYDWLARSMRKHGKSIECSRLRGQVKAMVEIIEESFESTNSENETTDDDEPYFKIDRIVGVRFDSNSELLYLVRWSGFDSDDDTWEPRDKLIEDGCRDRIEHFHRVIA